MDMRYLCKSSQGRRNGGSNSFYAPQLEDVFQMRLTSLSAVGRRAAFLLILALLALAGSTPLLAQGGEADLRLPDLSQAVFLNGVSGPTLLMIGLGVSRLGLGVRHGDVHAPAESAGARVDARDLRADLRDLQDLPDHAGQVPADPGDFHRRDHRVLLRRPAIDGRIQGGDHSGVQPDRNRRQLRRGVVRHSREHVRQFAHGVRQPARQAVPLLRDSAARPA